MHSKTGDGNKGMSELKLGLCLSYEQTCMGEGVKGGFGSSNQV